MSNPDQNGDDTQDKSGKKRVNITIYPDLHKRSHTYASEHGTTFSELVARALYDYMEPGRESAQNGNIQSLVKRLDTIESKTEDNNDKLGRLFDLVKKIEDQMGSTDEHVAQQIEAELVTADHPLSIPDLTEQLSTSPSVIEAGLKHLEEQFVVERQDPSSPETGNTRWKLLD